MATPHGLKILVVEDEPTVLALIARAIERLGFHPLPAATAAAARDLAASEQIGLAVCDVRLAEMSGPALMQELQSRGMSCPVLFISGDDSLDAVEGALGVKKASFLPKPFEIGELEAAILQAFRQR